MNRESEIINVRVDEIIPNRFQPRLAFDENELKTMAESIKTHGIIQPLILRRIGEKFEIIAGERRYKAAVLAGLQTVPAVIMNIDDKESAEVAVVENLQRRDLTAIEEAQSYKKILDMGYLTQEELANKMGVSQPTIANKLRLLNLAIPVKDALLHNQISERHARSLLALTDTSLQIAMLNRIISERLTVRQTDEEIAKILGKPSSSEEESDGENTNPSEQSNTLTNDNISRVPEENIPNASTNIFDMPSDIANSEVPPTGVKPASEELDTNNEDLEPPEMPEIPEIEETRDFSNFNTQEPVNNFGNNPYAFDVDVSKIKSESENIIQEHAPSDIDMLLRTEVEVEKQPETKSLEEVEANMDMGDIVTNPNMAINPFQEEPSSPLNFEVPSNEYNKDSEPTNSLIEEFRRNQTPTASIEENPPVKSLSTAINKAREEVKNIESLGFNVETEEFDFEDMYQIIIKIKKD